MRGANVKGEKERRKSELLFFLSEERVSGKRQFARVPRFFFFFFFKDLIVLIGKLSGLVAFIFNLRNDCCVK